MKQSNSDIAPKTWATQAVIRNVLSVAWITARTWLSVFRAFERSARASRKGGTE